ncbi:MAG: adenylate/guanylate cyclase domain-containing protein [Candidatus Ancaeobacter aquaticus]|nr:adenylate/guanylate cyclase domain-containing protein [Candidatus Ancaeobacter aquaticus]
MKKFSRFLTGPKLGTLITLIVLVLMYIDTPFLHLFELKTIDARFHMRGRIEAGNNVALIAIDDRSIKELGRWPWPRRYFAHAVKYLKDCEAKVIGFDVLFTEPDRNSTLKMLGKVEDTFTSSGFSKTSAEGKNFLSYIESEKRTYDNDSALADAFKYAGNVVLPMYFTLPGEEGDKASSIDKKSLSLLERSSYLLTKLGVKDPRYLPLEATNVFHTINSLDEQALCEGMVNIVPDMDGELRWELFAIKFKGDLYPPITLQMARLYLNIDMAKIKLITSDAALLPNEIIPLSMTNKLFINYYGPNGSFPYYSFIDVFNKTVPAENLKGKIIIIGATAPGLGDLKVTPFSPRLSGMEKHANVIQNILDNRFLKFNMICTVINILFIIFFGIGMGYILGRATTIKGIIIFLVTMTFFIAASQALFSHLYLVTNIVYPFIALFLTYGAVTASKLLTEERERKKIKNIFRHYASEQIVTQLLANPEDIKLGGEKREITILFSDIQNFTSISEALEPEQIAHILNKYLTKMTNIVFKHGGTVDKFMGDAIMALFSAPLYYHDHAYKACAVALEMVAVSKEFEAEWKEMTKQALKIRIGINTGVVVVGNMGSEKLMDYTAIGDAVNTTQRFEQLNKEYNTHIIIGETTYNEIKDRVEVRELGEVNIKGKNKRVRTYELKGLK